ncbi:alkaline phosphatase D family protein [Peribacillus butanolivorans]|uniref:alkaline phosphatase D family protein n=1 Tax=Peribacillus butanolivorans TaxID=421767 RepID=UPI0037FF9F31
MYLHALYKTSPDLQAVHAAFPVYCNVDDHEVENDWANGISQPDGEESNQNFLAVRAASFQAYYEHLPNFLRNAVPCNNRVEALSLLFFSLHNIYFKKI